MPFPLAPGAPGAQPETLRRARFAHAALRRLSAAAELLHVRLAAAVEARAGMCLVMHDIEALKPTNTGWLIADTVADTFAFGWSRTEVDPRLLELLADPQWQPYLVFPGEYVAAERVVNEVAPLVEGKRPLFILLDAT